MQKYAFFIPFNNNDNVEWYRGEIEKLKDVLLGKDICCEVASIRNAHIM